MGGVLTVKQSECCGAAARVDGAEEVGLCPKCKEHCQFVEDEAEALRALPVLTGEKVLDKCRGVCHE